jgi:hypothetical protein
VYATQTVPQETMLGAFRSLSAILLTVPLPANAYLQMRTTSVQKTPKPFRRLLPHETSKGVILLFPLPQEFFSDNQLNASKTFKHDKKGFF